MANLRNENLGYKETGKDEGGVQDARVDDAHTLLSVETALKPAQTL